MTIYGMVRANRRSKMPSFVSNFMTYIALMALALFIAIFVVIDMVFNHGQMLALIGIVSDTTVITVLAVSVGIGFMSMLVALFMSSWRLQEEYPYSIEAHMKALLRRDMVVADLRSA